MRGKMIVIREPGHKYDGWWFEIDRFKGGFPPGPKNRETFVATGEYEGRAGDGATAEVYRRV